MANRAFHFCGHQERGHFQHGSADSNLGNFIDIVHFHAETDELLANHLKHVPRNALYTSNIIQNILIEVVRQCILKDIISMRSKNQNNIPSLWTR